MDPLISKAMVVDLANNVAINRKVFILQYLIFCAWTNIGIINDKGGRWGIL